LGADAVESMDRIDGLMAQLIEREVDAVYAGVFDLTKNVGI
jgi:hypothetical protein